MSDASAPITITPTSETNRIESLDVFRGFALLGILLLNIIGFGLLSPSYSNPAFDLIGSSAANSWTWGTVEVFAEGAMRCLFSILFGAGVVLFTTGNNAKSGWTHYKRTFWLLVFGLFDAYLLLWNGDILVTYALAGAVLYLLRNKSAKTLFILSGALVLLMSLQHLGMAVALKQASILHEEVMTADAAGQSDTVPADKRAAADSWRDFANDFTLDAESINAELVARTHNYPAVLYWNTKKNAEMYSMVLPMFLIWDALAMMLLGMAFYKTGVLQAVRAPVFYTKMMVFGFGIGLLVNGYEVHSAYTSHFDLFATFAQMQPTYHIGRTGMAFGYIGLLGWICQQGYLKSLTTRLSAVGRMALTNYLMHSLICAIIFTGLGFGLLGQFQRVELYAIVIGIWLFQLWLSPLWLMKFRFGPVEWLWRTLTYGIAPAFKR
tara:strand:+ start:28548 stop:29855 length:1308 start_codon:yes stop_codon:yes gene_type:complete